LRRAVETDRVMIEKTQFPLFRWVVRTLTGPWARRTYVAIVLFLLCLTAAARVHSYLAARKIQAVLHGLAEMRVDQTTEEQLLKTVPYLTQRERQWEVGGIVQPSFYTEISTVSSESVRPTLWFLGLGEITNRFARWLGYRRMDFDAQVLVQDGKVSQVSYGLTKGMGWPRAATYVVSARSVHGFWLPQGIDFGVSSEQDESPQYRIEQRLVPSLAGRDNGLNVTFTNDAPPEVTRRAFQLRLSCLWGLRGCGDAREIAPGLWQDSQTIQATTYQRLISEKCPDSIIEGRMRYLPDVSVSLLEVTGSRRIDVNEEGDGEEDWFTDYRLKEQIRGRSFLSSWTNVRFRRAIPLPGDSTRTMTNQIWPQTDIGSQVLFFDRMKFASCRIIPATPSALDIVRKTPVPAKRPEDEIQTGLM